MTRDDAVEVVTALGAHWPDVADHLAEYMDLRAMLDNRDGTAVEREAWAALADDALGAVVDALPGVKA